jgi:hypothetical protein
MSRKPHPGLKVFLALSSIRADRPQPEISDIALSTQSLRNFVSSGKKYFAGGALRYVADVKRQLRF